MNFNYERTLENGIFTTTIKFDSFGYTDMTAEEETALFTDLGYPIIDAGGPEYEGFFKIVDNSVVMQDTSSADTQSVKLVINSKEYTIDSNFTLSHEVDSNKIADSVIRASTVLNTKLKLAEAKCILFEKNITRKIKAAIKAIKDQATKFEADTPEKFGA